MAERAKMICAECGVAMNFHAEKIDYSAALEGARPDPDFGGVVEEAHSCPKCGRTAVRLAPAAP